MRFRLLLAVTVVAALPSCGLPNDGTVQPYNDDEVPGDLTATTTTTTTPPPATTRPLDEPPATSAIEETTTTLVETDNVELYFLIGNTDQVQRITTRVVAPASFPNVLEILASPPPDDVLATLGTAVTDGLVESVEPVRGVGNVTLNRDKLDRLLERQQRRAISQIVLTVLDFNTDRGGIGSVLFFVDGEPISVFLPSISENGDPDTPVVFEDFASLISTEPISPVDSSIDPGSPEATTTTPQRTGEG